MKVERVSTGSEHLDRFLNGGLEKGIVNNVYGESGSGKTNLCVQVAAHVAENGGKVAYIDTEAGFSPERFLQMSNEEALDNILIRSPTDFEQQEEAIESLEETVEEEDVELVIVDSAVSLYRLKVNGDNASEINNQLSGQLSQLTKIAREHNIPVLITNQVYTSFDEGNMEIVGKDVPKYWSKCLLKLSDKGKNLRQMEIAKHRSLPEGKKIQFKITDDGLEEPEKKGLF
ncbi:MAG: DNA repair and recombination protein RadB [Candidatus Nanohalobium sp.]